MQEEFANYIITKDIRFKHAKGMRDIIGQELHTYHEIFFFIDGDTEFVSEYGTQKLLPLTTLIIPKNTFHCFEVHCDEKEYQRCVLNFGSVFELDEIINIKLKHIFITKSKKIADIFIKMKDLEKSHLSQIEKELLIKAFFIEILVELEYEENYRFDSDISPIASKIISYINQNIEKTLSVEELSSKLYISKSHLSHIFKKHLRIPLHKYILERRLILANTKIKNGIPAMQAATESGFSDYSGFYKQYKKMFGFAPTKTKNGF